MIVTLKPKSVYSNLHSQRRDRAAARDRRQHPVLRDDEIDHGYRQNIRRTAVTAGCDDYGMAYRKTA